MIAWLVILALIEGVPCTAADYPFFQNCDPMPPPPCDGPCWFDCPRKGHIWLCTVPNCRETEYYRTHCAHVAAQPSATPSPSPTASPTLELVECRSQVDRQKRRIERQLERIRTLKLKR